MKQVYETLGDKWDLDQPTTKLFEERLRTATSTPPRLGCHRSIRKKGMRQQAR